MSRRTSQHAATRRDIFGTMGAMLLLTAAEAGPAKAAELDGELLSLCNEAVAVHVENVAASDAIDAAGRHQIGMVSAISTESAHGVLVALGGEVAPTRLHRPALFPGRGWR